MSSSQEEPIYILGKGYTSGMVVRFDMPSHSARLDKVDTDKAEDIASVYVIPDDVEGSNVAFDPEEPPSVDEYSIPYHQAKYVKKWSAQLASTYVVKSHKPSRSPIPMWYPSGAAVLLQHSALKYTYVSELTYSFEMQPRDEVVEFKIAMHDKDALEPRAWVRGRNNFYLLSEQKVVPVKEVCEDYWGNPYRMFDPYPHDKYQEQIGELVNIKNVTDSKNYNKDEFTL